MISYLYVITGDIVGKMQRSGYTFAVQVSVNLPNAVIIYASTANFYEQSNLEKFSENKSDVFILTSMLFDRECCLRNIKEKASA